MIEKMRGKWSLRVIEESTEAVEIEVVKEGDTRAKLSTLPWECVGTSGSSKEKLKSDTSSVKEEVLGF